MTFPSSVIPAKFYCNWPSFKKFSINDMSLGIICNEQRNWPGTYAVKSLDYNQRKAGGMKLTGDSAKLAGKTCPRVTLFTTNSTWTGLGNKPGPPW